MDIYLWWNQNHASQKKSTHAMSHTQLTKFFEKTKSKIQSKLSSDRNEEKKINEKSESSKDFKQPRKTIRLSDGSINNSSVIRFAI